MIMSTTMTEDESGGCRNPSPGPRFREGSVNNRRSLSLSPIQISSPSQSDKALFKGMLESSLWAKMGHPSQENKACRDVVASFYASTASGSKVRVVEGLLGPEGRLSPGIIAFKGCLWRHFFLYISRVLAWVKGSGF
eukprot:CAMPEP_0185791772 /NCGR_PEP_ID=MMETSP1174-20130828/158567_1 /TAXON_ID=35687 /ORGANISM="Dictyocha speculum, Strain CCMP1381" /LENGTH=136 /DNA_ID=CAMNT_0028486767 /DNA_START=145 /DNA_END=556 /DNA_ORIENTATION=-